MTSDPFDFQLGFKPSGERLRNEREERLANAAKQLPYNHAFLDDCLRSIMPNDLVVIGARTGVGKTELARSIATSNARAGRRVHYFALEAEANEIERRTKFTVLASLLYSAGVRTEPQFNYPDWYRGRFEADIGALDGEADRIIRERYATLHTYYRGPRFDHDDIRRLLLAYQDSTDLFVLDHLHYVDIADDNENRGLREVMSTLRNTALLVGLPVILVVHLRKRATGSKSLTPSMDDIHGSSDVAKICTHAIMLEPAFPSSGVEPRKGHSLTFFSVPKDRGDGAKHLIALCAFDWRSKSYTGSYTLGRDAGGKFEALGSSEVPYWAARHEPLVESFLEQA